MTDIKIFNGYGGQGQTCSSFSYRVPEDYYGKTAYLSITYIFNPLTEEATLSFANTGLYITKTHVSQSVVDANNNRSHGKTYVYEGTLQGGTIEVGLSGWERKTLTVMLIVKWCSDNSGGNFYYLGQGTAFSVASIPGYRNLTEANFIVVLDNSVGGNTYTSQDWCPGAINSYVRSVIITPKKTYNATTGLLQLDRGYYMYMPSEGYYDKTYQPYVYLYTGELKTIN